MTEIDNSTDLELDTTEAHPDQIAHAIETNTDADLTGLTLRDESEGVGGDTYFAVIEFSNPVHAEALLTYGNWSKAGSPHLEDQVRMNSKKEMRPVWRDRKDIEANLESRKVF